MKGLRLLLFLAVVVATSLHGANARADDFRGWASFIVAGDWTGGRGETIEAFDIARRDLARAFERPPK